MLHDKPFIECEAIPQKRVNLSQQLMFDAFALVFARKVHEDKVTDCRLLLLMKNCWLWMENANNVTHVTVQHVTNQRSRGHHGHSEWKNKEQQFSTPKMFKEMELLRLTITTMSYYDDCHKNLKWWYGPSFTVHENRHLEQVLSLG